MKWGWGWGWRADGDGYGDRDGDRDRKGKGMIQPILVFFQYTLDVLTDPDHGSRDSDVVLVRRTIGSGKPRGLGIWDGEGLGGGGQFTSNLGPRWTGSLHAKGGFPSK